MMGFVLLRIVATLVIALGGGAGVLILLGIGQTSKAIQCGVITAILVWFVQPSAEDRADFDAFQKSREPWQPPQ